MSVFLYPLANYSSTAEVVHGGKPGYNGLGDVNSFVKHPMLDYNSIYFDGSDSSYVELSVGRNNELSNSDWSFVMFMYSAVPYKGTVFDFIYDGLPKERDTWSTNIRLELNESHMLLTMRGPDEEDYGSTVIDKPTIFISKTWIPLSVVHKKSNGRIQIQTENQMLYKSQDFQNNQNDVKLPLPAKIKLGNAYNLSNPFEGLSVLLYINQSLK